jgi:hypothetical protein
MEQINAKLNDDTEEFWAYMLGDIVHSVVEVLGAHRADGRKIKRRTARAKA